MNYNLITTSSLDGIGYRNYMPSYLPIVNTGSYSFPKNDTFKIFEFNISNSYFNYEDKISKEMAPRSYYMPPNKNIDVFSDLPKEVYSEKYNKQMAKVMSKFVDCYYSISRLINIMVPISLPKFNMYTDEDNANIIEFVTRKNKQNLTVYFSFEENDNESSFGVVFKDDESKDYWSRSGLICKHEHNICDFLKSVSKLILCSAKG